MPGFTFFFKFVITVYVWHVLRGMQDPQHECLSQRTILCSFWGLNSGGQPCATNTFTHSAISFQCVFRNPPPLPTSKYRYLKTQMEAHLYISAPRVTSCLNSCLTPAWLAQSPFALSSSLHATSNSASLLDAFLRDFRIGRVQKRPT